MNLLKDVSLSTFSSFASFMWSRDRNASLFINPTSFMCVFSNDEDEEVHSTDPESKEKNKDKKSLCKVKWSRDEVSLGTNEISLFMCCKHLHDGEG